MFSSQDKPRPEPGAVRGTPSGRAVDEREHAMRLRTWRRRQERTRVAWQEWLEADAEERDASYQAWLEALAGEEAAAGELERAAQGSSRSGACP